jgi:hypothetical protein
MGLIKKFSSTLYLEFYASPYEGRTPFTKRPTIQSFKKQLSEKPLYFIAT